MARLSNGKPQESHGDCIKNDGDYFSPQNAVKAVTKGKYGKGWAADAFLGNAVSGLIGGVQSIAQGNDMRQRHVSDGSVENFHERGERHGQRC